MNTNVLKGRIIAKFGQLSTFAEAAGWKPDRVTRMLSGKQKITFDDMHVIVKVLELKSAEEIVEVFSLTA